VFDQGTIRTFEIVLNNGVNLRTFVTNSN